MSKLRSFVGLGPRGRRLALRALVALPAVVLGLRWLGYVRCHRWLQGLARKRRPRDGSPATLVLSTEALRAHSEDALWALRLAERNFPWSVQCLERSLCLWWLLARDQVPAQLRIGVRRAAAGIEAHAWVEVMGHPLDEADIGQKYRPFADPLLAEPVARAGAAAASAAPETAAGSVE